MLALIVGSTLAVLGLLFVLQPLLGGAGYTGRSFPAPPSEEASAIEALREIEFDLATGKLSVEDYASLRAAYAPMALAELEARDAGVRVTEASDVAAREIGIDAWTTGDVAEQMIARMKARQLACSECGPRPESDAIFCSDCGRYLSPGCLRCGAIIDDPHARYCGECGSALAA